MSPNGVVQLIASTIGNVSVVPSGTTYTTKIAALPVFGSWDAALPLVVLVPERRNVRWIRMKQCRNIQQFVAVHYLYTSSLVYEVSTAVDAFKMDMVHLFQSSVTAAWLAGSGIWRSQVEDRVEFKPINLPKNWLTSSLVVKMDFTDQG